MKDIPYRFFLFLLIFSPIAFGARDPWALGVIEVSCFFGVLSCLTSRHGEEPFYKVPGFLPLGFFLFWILFQIVPLPTALVKLISPVTFAIYQDSLTAFGDVNWMSLSVAPGRTLSEFFRFSTYVAFYWLTIQLLADQKRLKKTVLVVAGLASVMALYAIVETLFTNGKIYGFYSGPGDNTHIGPYVYHNHYAGFMGMVFPVVLSLYLYYRPKARYGSWRENLVALFGGLDGHLHLLLGFAAILVGTSVFLSLSRGGIISLCLSMICFTILLSAQRKGPNRNALLLVSGLLIILFVSWFGWEPIVGQFKKTLTDEGEITDSRFNIWDDSAGILRDFSIAGSGFGTFGEIYPTYRTLPGSRSVGHAHNDYLELVSSGGVIGLLLVCWFLAALFGATWRGYRRRRDPFSKGLYVGAISGLLAIFFHSVVDFNFYSNANGLIFFFVCGLAVSASHTSRRKNSPTYLRDVSWPSGRGVIAGATLFFVAVVSYQGGILWAGVLFSGIRGTVLTAASSDETLGHVEKKLQMATLASPFDPLYPSILASISVLKDDWHGADNHFQRSLRLSPVNSGVLQSAARHFCRHGEGEKGRVLFEAAIAHDRVNPQRYKLFAGWLLEQGQTDAGRLQLQRAMAVSCAKKTVYDSVSLLMRHGFSYDDILHVLPERVCVRFVFADMILKFGDKAFSRDVVVDSLAFAETDDQIKSWHFAKIYRVYMDEKNYEMARFVMTKAMGFFPGNAHLHILTGDMYVKMGISYRAVEEYRQALSLDPMNSKAKNRLDRLAI